MHAPSDAAMEDGVPRAEGGAPTAPKRHRLSRFLACLLSEWPLDVLAVVAAAAVTIGTRKIPPRQGYITNVALANASYPVYPNSVPSWSVPVISMLAPAVAIIAVQLLRRRPWRELYRLLVALLGCVLFTCAVTNLIKPAVGRLRPHFLNVCWPDGVVVWRSRNAYGGFAACTGAEADVQESYRSFFSGHSSWTAAGLGFLTFYFLGQLRAYSGPGHAWRLLLSLIPALGAIAVGITRVRDYWHHPSDVWVGLLVGYGMAFAWYRQLYPSLADVDCDLPMYLRRRKGT